MKCQKCGKYEATIKYSENVNGNKKSFNLCYDCYKNLKFSSFSNVFSPMLFDIPEFIEEKNRCDVCNSTFDDYANTGLFGCPNCYNVFENKLDKIFLKIHGKNKHVYIKDKQDIKTESDGKQIFDENRKTAEDMSKEQKINDLKNQIKKLIESENYEKAAIIRDEIKKIEGK